MVYYRLMPILEEKMEYLTTSQIAEKWNISRRRVSKLCSEGRIEGAKHMGNLWLVPEGAKKPEDKRLKMDSQSNE